MKNRRPEPGQDLKILSDRMLRIKGSAEHSRWICVDRPSCSVDEKLHNNAPHRKMPSETTTACVSLLIFFRIRRGTFPYGVEDDASTISQRPTTHYTSTCVKLTIVTHLSFSERIAIANLSYSIILVYILWAMAKNGSSRCVLAKNGCTLKTIAAASVERKI